MEENVRYWIRVWIVVERPWIVHCEAGEEHTETENGEQWRDASNVAEGNAVMVPPDSKIGKGGIGQVPNQLWEKTIPKTSVFGIFNLEIRIQHSAAEVVGAGGGNTRKTLVEGEWVFTAECVRDSVGLTPRPVQGLAEKIGNKTGRSEGMHDCVKSTYPRRHTHIAASKSHERNDAGTKKRRYRRHMSYRRPLLRSSSPLTRDGRI
ncbi:hypothetical protein R3P38DRAFT_3353687 [Favolaschia claudopus]|uniref:Ribosomal protein L2 n=1 Tax=Favolaschia claudopus TaxID=2862362 RepID=A0AAW0BTZ2_9AGAR